MTDNEQALYAALIHTTRTLLRERRTGPGDIVTNAQVMTHANDTVRMMGGT